MSVLDLQKAIIDFLTTRNFKPKPFIWAAKIEGILKKIDRARAKLEEIKTGCIQPTEMGFQQKCVNPPCIFDA